MSMPSPWLARTLDFLRGIGLAVHEERLSGDDFLPGVRIRGGGLVCAAERLLASGDLLHEAGHLAVTRACDRAALEGELDDQDGDSAVDEVAAIAWSYAAAVHLGMPLDELFHPQGYRGQAAALAMTYAAGVYPGVGGLVACGMTVTGAEAVRQGVAPYPHLLRWLRE